ncbi:MED7 protein-domain-containing protein [Trametes polyzona]|nr:MED7 protein-domain-containing protein [Trametes polyzona]
MDDEETELRNPFPSPPSHYTRYTSHNLKLLALLRERAGPDADLYALNQYEVLSDQTDVPDWPLAQLEKPRVDWILEEGHYTVFGDTWFIKEKIPSLAELGGHQLYPTDPNVGMCWSHGDPLRRYEFGTVWTDRRPALRSILRSLLVTYSKLLDALLLPPPTASSQIEAEWKRHLEWINILAQNIMAAANDLRPVQARANLELMMRHQLEVRREETKAIHSKCDALEAQLADLRLASQGAASHSKPVVSGIGSSFGQPMPSMQNALQATDPSMDDVLAWAEEVA